MENKSTYILEELSEEQRKAVECTDGPVLIVAGAGSGKTRVLTSRIAYLIANGCEPERIMALTFTKKAAGEMKERISSMVGGKLSWKLCMGTFHSVFIRFLREFSDKLGYPSTFTIYDTSDSQSAIKACIKELKLDDKTYKPKDVLSRISMAKNNLVTAEAYKAKPTLIASDTRSRKPRICDIYSLYVQKCKASGVMDFDDILLNMNILFRDHPDVLEQVASRYSYIMVDEYQDTNYAQYLIVKKLSMFHNNICVVGDDSQSIYAFRGARIENILNFRRDFPQCKTFRLERNYRSTEVIVKASNSLIARNEGRIPKECRANSSGGERITVLKAYNEQEEAVLIASSIMERIQRDKARYQDFAILYRTNSQSRAIEEVLRKRNLPYIIYSGHSFFDRAEVKDLMAYFKLVCNPDDDEAFKRAVKVPSRGIGDTSMTRLAEYANASGKSLYRTVVTSSEEIGELKRAAMDRLRSFCNMLGSLSQHIQTEDAYTLAKRIADDSGLYVFYRADTSIEGMSRLANIDELLNSVSSYVEDQYETAILELENEGQEVTSRDAVPVPRLDGFLENISLLSSVDIQDDEDVSNKIALMTVHSSKGLEFPYVYVAGLEENLFPSGGMLAMPNEIEEERRLFYVALTRAEKAVGLSFAQTRMRNGNHESNSMSRFLKEIDPTCLDSPLSDDASVSFSSFGSRASGGRSGYSYGASSRVTYYKNDSKNYVSSFRPSERVVSNTSGRPLQPQKSSTVVNHELDPDFVPESMTSFQIGQRIEHNRFGAGLILDISGVAPELKAKISFDGFPEPKLILLKYAKMRHEK